MDERFWADLDAARKTIERATAGIDMSELAIAAENAARVAGTIDFEKASLAFALGDTAVRWHDRLSANSALVSETLASMIARDSVALHSTVNLVADAFVPTTSTLESLGAELARALKPSRAVVASLSAWEASLTARMTALKTSWMLPDRFEQSVIGFARLSRLSDAVHTSEPYSPQVAELISAELGDSFETQPDDNADERDAAAVRAGLNPDLIAFPRAAYGEVVLAAGFNVRFTPMTAPQASESADLDTAFDSMHWRLLTELEQRLRHIVEKTLTELVGSNWIKQRVSQSVRQRWEERQENDRIAGRPVYATIQYADFMDLADVVGQTNNWDDVFQPIFQNREDFTVSLRRLHPVRKSIAHSRPLCRADVLTLVNEATRILGALGMRVLN